MSQSFYVYPAPRVDSLRLVVRQVPLVEDLWLQSEWTMEAKDGCVELPMAFPLDGAGARLVLLVYADAGASVRVEGTDVTPTTVDDLPGKTVYRHMQGPYSQELLISIELPEEGGMSAMAIAAVLVVAVVALGILGFVVITRRRRSAGTGDGEGGDADDGGASAPGEVPGDGEGEAVERPPSELTVEQLELQKRRLLEAIKRVDAELEDGLICKEEHASMRAGYKSRAVEVMRELDGRKPG